MRPSLILTVSLFGLVPSLVLSLPVPGIKPCPVGSDDLENCIESSLNSYLLHLSKGLGDDIPPLDPLVLPFVETNYDDKNVTLNLHLENVEIRGMSSSKIYGIKARSLEEGKLELMCKTPKIGATGSYLSEGAVITFPLHSSGTFNVTLVDLTTHLIIHFEGTEDGHIKVVNIGLNVMPAQIDIEGGMTLDEDNSLGVALNTFLNENSFELYELVRPSLMAYFSGMIKDISNTLLEKEPVEGIFPDLDLRR